MTTAGGTGDEAATELREGTGLPRGLPLAKDNPDMFRLRELVLRSNIDCMTRTQEHVHSTEDMSSNKPTDSLIFKQ